MNYSKKLIAIPLGIYVLLSAAVVNGSMLQTEKYSNFSNTFSNQKNFTLEEAKEIAQRNVPSNSICFYTEEDINEYEFKFYNDEKMEEYKIEIDKASRSIIAYKIELYDDVGSLKVNLNEAEINQIVLKEIPRAEILSVKLDKDDMLSKYKVRLKVDSYYGKFEINPETGVILEKEFNLNYKYEYNYDVNNYITIDKVKEIALKEIYGGTITDIDIENYHDMAVYEIEVKSDNNKYKLVLNALTGEKISLTSNYNRTQNVFNNMENTKDIITVEEAKQIVLNKVPGAVIKKIELDYDDGTPKYEGEIYKGNYEYEFEIDAYTGNILEWEEEFDD